MTVSKRNKTALYPPGSIAGYALKQDVFTTSDSVYNYTLSEIPFEDFEIVSFSGRVMARGASHDYTVSGNDIVLGFNPHNNRVLTVHYWYKK